MQPQAITAPRIECLNLQQQHRLLKQEIFAAFEEVYDATAFSDGPFVNRFETAFAQFCNTRYAVGVNNGTSALHLALLALGVGAGDEVIVPANTFIATAWAVSYTGATPVFVDCTRDTWQVDASKLEEKITDKTKAVIGVHLYGQPFDVSAVQQVCKKHQLYLLEDAAQAHGATYNGGVVGSFGAMGCFSFYPGKNLGACGEAGAISTNNEAYFSHVKRLRNHGSTQRYHHTELGFNMRMGGLEGASLFVKLQHLNNWNQRRRAIAHRYQKQIVNPKLQFQAQPPWSESVYHLFVITTKDRNHLINYLNGYNIYPGLHYPVPCHLQQAYKHLGYTTGDCPNAEYLAAHCLSLPMYAELKDAQVAYIIDVLNSY